MAIWFALGFGVLGYVMRSLGISPLPFVIAFILGEKLEATARQAYSATGQDPFFLFSSVTAATLMCAAIGIVVFTTYQQRRSPK